MKYRFFHITLFLVGLLLNACGTSEQQRLLQIEMSTGLHVSNEVRQETIQELLAGLKSEMANAGSDSFTNLLVEDGERLQVSYKAILRAIDSCQTLSAQALSPRDYRAKIDALLQLVNRQETEFVEMTNRWNKMQGDAHWSIANLNSSGQHQVLLNAPGTAGWTLQLQLIENRVLVNTETVLKRLDGNLMSAILCGLKDAFPLVKLSKNVYRIGETVEARIFMSYTDGMGIERILVDGYPLPLRDEHAVFKRLANEPGEHQHEVIIEIRRAKTGQIDEYATDFNYYVIEEGE